MESTVNRTPNNLTRQISSFVGRETELAHLQKLLLKDRAHLVTVTGTGGAGKTRLALEVAWQVLSHFRDGIWLVDLSSTTDPALVGQATARVFSLPETRAEQIQVTLRDYLKTKNLLLLLDNCEHLLDESARLVAALLQECPELYIMATSRERLGLNGEHVIYLPPLPLPPADRDLAVADLAGFEAVQLFIRRVQAIQPNFELGPENVGPVVQVCRQLDGLPLALELAAAQLSSLGVTQVAERLGDRFRLLSNNNRMAQPRQQTIQTLLDWSINLLTEREIVLFRRLAVFDGSFSLEAAEQVGTGSFQHGSGSGILESGEIAGLLSSLVNKSLVQPEPETGRAGVFRYRLLETVREYARPKLLEAEYTQVQQNLFEWCLNLALATQPELEGPEQARWLQHLEKEYLHFRAALKWALTTQAPLLEKAVQLALALAGFWQKHGHIVEGGHWFLEILGHSGFESLGPERRAQFLHWAGILLNPQNAGQARAINLQNLQLSAEQGDIAGQVKALTQLGWLAYYQLDYEQANRHDREALALAAQLNDPATRIDPLYLQAIIGEQTGEYEVAVRVAEECLAYWRATGDTGSVTSAVTLLAVIQTKNRRYEQARNYLTESLDLQDKVDSPVHRWLCLNASIRLLLAQSGASLAPSNFRQFARWLGAVQNAFDKLGGSPPLITRKVYGEVVGQVRARLDHSIFNTALQEGQSLALTEALEQAREMLNLQSAAPKPARPLDSLTSRELEVLRLVAKGLSNPDIGQELAITPRTVNAHLTSIYSKLGVVSRSGAIRYALENNLA